MNHIRSFLYITTLIISLAPAHPASAFLKMPSDTTLRKECLIDSLKEGEVYKLVISSYSCWTGSIFTMEITQKDGRYIVNATDTVISSYEKMPRARFGPALVSAAGLDSIRAIEAELATPPVHTKGDCFLSSNYIISAGSLERRYTDYRCLYVPNYRQRLTWLVKDWAVRSVVL